VWIIVMFQLFCAFIWYYRNEFWWNNCS